MSSSKKPKKKAHDHSDIDEDDSYFNSDGAADSGNFEVAARRRVRKTKRLYKFFIKENRNFWLFFNLGMIVISIVFGFGTYFILVSDKDCPSLRQILYATIPLNIMNVGVSAVNLTGNETKICSSNMICLLALIEITMMVWMQVTYFNAQECIS